MSTYNTLQEFDKILFETQNLVFEQKRDDIEPIHTRFTKAGDVSEEDYRDVDVAGLGLMAYTPLGGANHRDGYKQGNAIIVPFPKYTISLTTPEEVRKAMLSNGRVKKDKVKLFLKSSEEFARSADLTREYIAADGIVRANSTTATRSWAGTFRDGLAYASASHTLLKSGATWSNLQTGSAMTQLALLDGLAMLSSAPDENGFPQGSVGDVLLVYGPYNQFRVTELIKTPTTPDTANLTVNPLAMKRERSGTGNIIPILNPFLGDTYSGWSLFDAKNHGLTRFQKEEPQMLNDRNINNGDFISRCMQRFAIYARTAKGMVHNPGI